MTELHAASDPRVSAVFLSVYKDREELGRLAESGLANPRRDEAVCRQGGEGREEGDAPKARLPDTDHRQLHKPSEAIPGLLSVNLAS